MKPSDYPLRSPRSRAAARALVIARQENEAEDDWDREYDWTKIDIAGELAAARERDNARWRNGEVPEVSPQVWVPIHIPPGKENTVMGRKIADLNAARARVARFEAERGERG